MVSGLDHALPLWCAEAFAPVVAVAPFGRPEEAFELANYTPYGLQAGVFTESIDLAFHAIHALQFGGVIVNDVPTYRIDSMPYGGLKDSGRVGRAFGTRWRSLRTSRPTSGISESIHVISPAQAIGGPGRRLPVLDTPSVLVDRSRFEANLHRMAAHARAAGLDLRPHAKTHKSIAVGRRQIGLGAIGLTVAKPEEAMVFWRAGFRPIFLAYPPVGEHKLSRLRPAIEDAALIVGLDDIGVAIELGAFALSLGTTVPVMFEVDVGMARTGLAAGRAAANAALAVAAVPGIRLVGIYAHEGHAHGLGSARLPAFATEIAGRLRSTAELIRSAGRICEIVSAGTCLTSWHLHRDQGVTEIRPGTYVFNDVRTVVDGGANWEQCAISVLATVVSRPDPTRLVIDAGAKTLTTAFDETYGYGLILGIDGAKLARLSEEHGIVTLANPSYDIRVGDRVTVVPIHVCATVNMHHELFVVDGDEVVETLKVDAGLLAR